MSYFNDDQQDAMRAVASRPPTEQCWCGWCLAGQCNTPNPCPVEATMADRLKVTCACGGYPGKPGGRMFHRHGCQQAEAIAQAVQPAQAPDPITAYYTDRARGAAKGKP